MITHGLIVETKEKSMLLILLFSRGLDDVRVRWQLGAITAPLLPFLGRQHEPFDGGLA